MEKSTLNNWVVEKNDILMYCSKMKCTLKSNFSCIVCEKWHHNVSKGISLKVQEKPPNTSTPWNREVCARSDLYFIHNQSRQWICLKSLQNMRNIKHTASLWMKASSNSSFIHLKQIFAARCIISVSYVWHMDTSLFLISSTLSIIPRFIESGWLMTFSRNHPSALPGTCFWTVFTDMA